MSLPEYSQFSEEGVKVYKQWEVGIINAEEFRAKLRELGETIDGDEYNAMLREEADAANCPIDGDEYEDDIERGEAMEMRQVRAELYGYGDENR